MGPRWKPSRWSFPHRQLDQIWTRSLGESARVCPGYGGGRCAVPFVATCRSGVSGLRWGAFLLPWPGLQGLRGQGRGRGRGTARFSWKRTRNPQPVDHRLPAVKARHEQRRRKNKGNTVRVERIASHAPVTRLKRCTSTNTHTLTVARHASYSSMYTQSIKRVMKTTAHPHKREQMRHRAQTR